jgi:hypothetical protein
MDLKEILTYLNKLSIVYECRNMGRANLVIDADGECGFYHWNFGEFESIRDFRSLDDLLNWIRAHPLDFHPDHAELWVDRRFTDWHHDFLSADALKEN